MIKQVKYLIVFFSLIVTSSISKASDQFLDMCLRFAQARDKNLEVAEEQVKLSMTRLIRSTRAFLPVLSLERKYEKGKTYSGADPSIGLLSQEYQSESLGFRAQQPIFEGGRLSNTYKYDNSMLASAKYNYTKIREELFYKIKATYFEFLTAKMRYIKLKKTLGEINKLSERVELEYHAKAISKLDLDEAKNFRDKVENMFKEAESTMALTKRRLAYFANIESLDDIPGVIPEGLPEDVPEISYVLDECINFAVQNNVELKMTKLQIEMAKYKRRIIDSKIIPKIYLEGFYGRSGEADVSQPIPLAVSWSLLGKLSWGLWGNSLEIDQNTTKTNPNEATNPNARFDTNSLDIKFSFFDDLNYFVDSKESKVGFNQALASYDESNKKTIMEVDKSYSEYRDSLFSAKVLKDEIEIKERKLELLRKRNQLYEVTTLQLMQETVSYAETVFQYSKMMYTNYSNVSNLERLTLMPLR
ncbi:MAG: TolC family protein [Elusimicrobia bacterium]|nr:TolC family protein [Candidatus Liberimonas magnetica]